MAIILNGLNNCLFGIFTYSNTVNCTGHTQLMSSLFSAVVPVIKVVSTIVLISSLPFHESLGLMLNHNAFLEFSIVIFTSVSSIKWDLKGI